MTTLFEFFAGAKSRVSAQWRLCALVASGLALAGVLVAISVSVHEGRPRLWPVAGFLTVCLAAVSSSQGVERATQRRALRLLGLPVPDGLRLVKPIWIDLGGAFAAAVAIGGAAGVLAAAFGFVGLGLGIQLALVAVWFVAIKMKGDASGLTFEPSGFYVHVGGGRFFVPWTTVIDVELRGPTGQQATYLQLAAPERMIASARPNTRRYRLRAELMLELGSPRGAGLVFENWTAGLDAPTLARAIRQRLGDCATRAPGYEAWDDADASLREPPPGEIDPVAQPPDGETPRPHRRWVRWDLLFLIPSVLALGAVVVAMQAGLSVGHLWPVAAFLAVSVAAAAYRTATNVAAHQRALRQRRGAIPHGVRLRQPLWMQLNLPLLAVGGVALLGSVVAGIGYPTIALGIALAGLGIVVLTMIAFRERRVTLTLEDAGLMVHVGVAHCLVPWRSIHSTRTDGTEAILSLCVLLSDGERVFGSTSSDSLDEPWDIAVLFRHPRPDQAELALFPWAAGLDAKALESAIHAAVRAAAEGRFPRAN